MTTSTVTCGICSNPLSGEFFQWSINGGEYPLCHGCSDSLGQQREQAIAAGQDANTLPQLVSVQKLERAPENVGSSTMRLPDPDALRPIEPVAPVKDYSATSQFEEPVAKAKRSSAPLYILAVLGLGVLGCVVFLLVHH